jgi:hypothetical protein
MDKIGIALTGLSIVIIIAMCALPPEAAPPAQEQQLAEAYHCGMLDALQEKRQRGRACDEYKAIAKRKGVSVPP